MSSYKLKSLQAEIYAVKESHASQMHMLTNLIEMVKSNKLAIDQQSTQLAALSGCVAVPPPVKPELKGNDLCRAMLDRGDKLVLCGVSNNGLDYDYCDAITSYSGGYFKSHLNFWRNATPINNQGEPLTAQEVGL